MRMKQETLFLTEQLHNRHNIDPYDPKKQHNKLPADAQAQIISANMRVMPKIIAQCPQCRFTAAEFAQLEGPKEESG